MGILNEIAGIGYITGFAGGLGIATHPSQLAAMQAQQAFDPFAFQRQRMARMPQRQPFDYGTFLGQSIPRHVESKELTTRERTRKAVNDAVEAVKKAQQTA